MLIHIYPNTNSFKNIYKKSNMIYDIAYTVHNYSLIIIKCLNIIY